MSNQIYQEVLKLTEQDVFLAKQGGFTLHAIKELLNERSSELGERICKLLYLDPAPRNMFIESNRGTPTFSSIHNQIVQAVAEQRTILEHDEKAKTKSGAISSISSVQYTWNGHQKVWSHLTSEVMYSLLPERVHIDEVILALWNDASLWAREQLLFVLRFAPLKYGAWRAFKVIFKEAEVRMDWEVYSILDTRLYELPRWKSTQGPRYLYITSEDQEAKESEMEIIRTQEEAEEEIKEKLDALNALDSLNDEQEREKSELEDQAQVLRASLEKAYEHRDLEPSVINWDSILRNTQYNAVKLSAEGDLSIEGTYLNEVVDPSDKTIAYLKRRSRRTLRNLAKDFPESFSDVASEFLLSQTTHSLAQNFIRARTDLFLHNQLALLKIVEQSASQTNVSWAMELLREEYRIPMKKVSGEWLYRVSQSKYSSTRALALDYLQNDTSVGIGEFHEEKYQYHKTIIAFLGIDGVEHNHSAVQFACEYLKIVGASPDNKTWLVDAFSLENISFLLSSNDESLRDLGMHLLQGNEGKSAYEEAFSLDFFSRLLSNGYACDFAMKQIRTRYTSLSPDWYIKQLNNPNAKARRFAQELIKDETMVAADVDWSDFCISLLSTIEAKSGVYATAWNKLTHTDIKGNKIIDNRESISMEFLRFLFVHPSYEVRNFTGYLIENEICTVHDLGVDFLKTISTKREYKNNLDSSQPWGNLLGKHMYPLLIEYLQDCSISNVYSDDIGSDVRIWLENEFTLSAIGLEWAFDRLQWWSPHYNFVRNMFKRDVTLPQLAGLMPPLSKPEFESSDAAINGARQVAWFVYHRCQNASSRKAGFFKSLLLERNERYRVHHGLDDLSADMVWPHETFDFDWFTRWGTSKREPIRAYAIKMAHYEMSHWISSGRVGFTTLRRFFSGYYDVQKAIVDSIKNPPQPINLSRIRLDQDFFVPSELYPYCFVDNEREVSFALNIIASYPELFGKPEDLLALSDAKGARVRQVVIQVLWYLYKAPTTTPGWKPFAYSVVPYDPSRAIDPVREAGVDPNTLRGEKAEYGKSKHFLGKGSAEAVSVQAKKMDQESRFDLHEFLRRILFTLPRSPEQNNAEQAARKAQLERQFGAAPSKKQKPLQASWKNKKQLVSTIRDLAIYEPTRQQNMSDAERQAFDEDQKDFALFMIPILEEFLISAQ